MKWLFLLLLAANLGYYFLGGDSAPESTDTPTAIAPDTPTILLLREAEQQGLYPLPVEAAAAAPAPEPAQDPVPAPDTGEPMPAQALPVSAADLHRAVYPEGDDVDAKNQSSPSQETAMEPDMDDRAPDANAAPPLLPPTSQAAQANTSQDPWVTRDNRASNARDLTADDAPRKTEAGDENPTPEAQEQARTAITNQKNCFRLGPFDQVATARAAGKKTMKFGFRGRLLQTTAQQGGYQVYLGPYSDPDERQFALDELTDNGINDITLGRGRHGNTLIIANYPSQERAKPMLATLQTLGYNPRIAKQSEAVRRFYLDLEAPDGSGSSSSRNRLTVAFPGIGLTNSTCRH